MTYDPIDQAIDNTTTTALAIISEALANLPTSPATDQITAALAVLVSLNAHATSRDAATITTAIETMTAAQPDVATWAKTLTTAGGLHDETPDDAHAFPDLDDVIERLTEAIRTMCTDLTATLETAAAAIAAAMPEAER